MMLDSQRFGRWAVHFVFFLIPVGSMASGFRPATAFYRERLHMGLWPSDILYFAAAIGAIFIFSKIASNVDDRLFARQSVGSSAR